jgi:guanidinopropionase
MTDGKGPADGRLQPRFAGLPTLLRTEHREGLHGLDVALVGVPHEATTVRNGTRFGPTQVREMSRFTRRINGASGVDPFTLCSVADIGDAPVHPLSLPATNEMLLEFYRGLVAGGVVPLSVGGDHGITLPILRALGERHGRLGMLQIDSHSDSFDEFFGDRENHATMVRRLIEEGALDPDRLVQVGIRGGLYGTDDLDWVQARGATIVSADRFFSEGVDAIVELVADTLAGGAVYITVDIDGLDPAVAPGTGVPEPGGLSYRDCRALILGLRGAEIVGGDLVEVAPPLDPTGITGRVAAGLLFEQLCVIAESVAAGRERRPS